MTSRQIRGTLTDKMRVQSKCGCNQNDDPLQMKGWESHDPSTCAVIRRKDVPK